jgi:hypothetical protein
MYQFWKHLAVGALSLSALAALQSPTQADGYVGGYAPVQPAFSWSGLRRMAQLRLAIDGLPQVAILGRGCAKGV